METFFRLATRERRLQFIYLVTAISGLTVLISGIAFRNNTYSQAEARRLSDRIKQQEQTLRNQLDNMPLLDSTYRAIVAYQPQVNAIFVEVELEDHLNEIRRLSAPQANGIQFRSFAQIADFYRMMYVDKKVVWSKQSNIGLFSKQLDDCSVGLAPAASPVVSSAPAGPSVTSSQ